jgi:hypothetical protein
MKGDQAKTFLDVAPIGAGAELSQSAKHKILRARKKALRMTIRNIVALQWQRANGNSSKLKARSLYFAALRYRDDIGKAQTDLQSDRDPSLRSG